MRQNIHLILASASLCACGGVSSNDPNAGVDGAPGLSVVSVTPADGTTTVDVDTPLIAELSVAPNAASVTDRSFVVTHGGVDVPGVIAVDGTTVTFTPTARWHIAADIRVEITTAVTAGSSTLDAPFTSGFATRDGAWMTPVLVAANVSGFSIAASGPAGHAVFPYADTGGNILAVVYEPIAGAFGLAQPLEALGLTFRNPVAAIDSDGKAIVVWEGAQGVLPEIIGWSRLDGAAWIPGQTQSKARDGNRKLALAANGAAVLVESGAADADSANSTFLSVGASSWTANALLQANSNPIGSGETGDTAQMLLYNKLSDTMNSRQLNPSNGTFAAPVVFGATGMINFAKYSTLPEGGASFTWQRNGNEVHWAVYSAGSWTSDKLGDGSGGGELCQSRAGKRIGVYRAGTTMLAVVAEPDMAFGAASNLGTLANVEYAECFIDESGGGHAFYLGFGDEMTSWSRLDAATGNWSTAVSLQVPSGVVRGINADPYGNVSIVFVEGNQAFAARFE